MKINLNKSLYEQDEDVKEALLSESWALKYEKRRFKFMLDDLQRGLNEPLQTAIYRFEDSNNIEPKKFISDSLIRYLESINITTD